MSLKTLLLTGMYLMMTQFDKCVFVINYLRLDTCVFLCKTIASFAITVNVVPGD